MNLWFMNGALPAVTTATFAEFPKLGAWYARLTAIGHGKHTAMEAKEALEIAKAATSDAKVAADPHDPLGRKPGDKVKVAADDYGRDPIAGEIVFSNAHEIAIRRSDPQVGDVVVHFPRGGIYGDGGVDGLSAKGPLPK